MTSDHMFPAFTAFAAKHRLLAEAKGSFSAKLPRVLGQGKTRAEGLDLPPAPVERRQELVSLVLPPEVKLPLDVSAEIETVRRELSAEIETLRRPEQQRRFATHVLQQLLAREIAAGVKDGRYYAGRLVLVHDKAGLNWSWCLTPHYPFVTKIPPDLDYVVEAHAAAERIIDETTVPPLEFGRRLDLAWGIARHFSSSEEVLIADVARAYKVAGQDERFWSAPARRNFVDIPDGSFVVNLMSWRRNSPQETPSRFEFVPATLHQAHGPNARPFYMPVNAEGTDVRPMIYLRRKGAST